MFRCFSVRFQSLIEIIDDNDISILSDVPSVVTQEGLFSYHLFFCLLFLLPNKLPSHSFLIKIQKLNHSEAFVPFKMSWTSSLREWTTHFCRLIKTNSTSLHLPDIVTPISSCITKIYYHSACIPLKRFWDFSSSIIMFRIRYKCYYLQIP